MKLSHQNQYNLIFAAAAGLGGFVLRALLYRIGFDEKNILSSSHPLHLITLVLTVAAAGYLVFRVRKQGPEAESGSLRFRLPAGLLAGCLLLSHGITPNESFSGMLTALRLALTLAGAGAMITSVFPQLQSRRVQMICHGLITAFFAVDMLCRYRSWSGNPQLPDYVFHVLCSICLSLCSYHRLAFDAGLAKPRIHRFCCLMAVYLCLLCLAGPEDREFYLGGAFWAAACLVTPEQIQEEETDVSA